MNFDALKKRNEIAKVLGLELDMVIGRLLNTTIIKRYSTSPQSSPEKKLLKFMYEPPLFEKFSLCSRPTFLASLQAKLWASDGSA